MRTAPIIVLTTTERRLLERVVKSRAASQRFIDRANIVLLAAEGLSNLAIAAKLRTNDVKVGRWRTRFAAKGIEGIEIDAYRPGRFAQTSKDIVDRIVARTTQTHPEGATHWSAAKMAAQEHVSESTVLRIWRRHGLKPHRVETFKLSNDPRFVEKLEDIVGLYLAPPEHAMVLCLDEKSQIQALDRTQPGLPLIRGKAATMTHDYKRNGTTTLFAALSVLDGTVMSTCRSRHTHKDWLAFLKMIDAQTPPEKTLHLIADNYATHKHATVQRWLKRHPRFRMHFTPTSSSWFNMVERFFRDLTTQSLRRGVFHSVESLIDAIEAHIAAHNANPKPMIWTKKASDILEKVTRARAKLHSIQSA